VSTLYGGIDNLQIPKYQIKPIEDTNKNHMINFCDNFKETNVPLGGQSSYLKRFLEPLKKDEFTDVDLNQFKNVSNDALFQDHTIPENDSNYQSNQSHLFSLPFTGETCGFKLISCAKFSLGQKNFDSRNKPHASNQHNFNKTSKTSIKF
jgi:hypothetical protein